MGIVVEGGSRNPKQCTEGMLPSQKFGFSVFRIWALGVTLSLLFSPKSIKKTSTHCP